jgi:hypothetical protein
MKELMDNRLVEPVNPMTVLENPWQICRPFIEYLNSPACNARKRVLTFQMGRDAQGQTTNFPRNVTRIHEDKFDYEIFYNLKEMGLAFDGEEGWYYVERITANELMTFLASVIGGKLQYQPATDQVLNRFTMREGKKEFEAYKMADGKRQHILNELIPFPEEIDLMKLREFKDRHHDLLKAFKNRIELIALDPLIDIHTSLFNEKLQELQLRKGELSAKMDESKLGKIILGTVCGILGGGAGIAAAGTAGGVLLAMPGFANAVYTALQIERAENAYDQSGLKYLALVDKRLRRHNS